MPQKSHSRSTPPYSSRANPPSSRAAHTSPGLWSTNLLDRAIHAAPQAQVIAYKYFANKRKHIAQQRPSISRDKGVGSLDTRYPIPCKSPRAPGTRAGHFTTCAFSSHGSGKSSHTNRYIGNPCHFEHF